MPLELVVESPKKVALVAYEDRALVDNEVLIRTTVSGIKHGTEINLYRGIVPFADQLWDPALRLFRPPRDDEEPAPFFPHRLGSWGREEKSVNSAFSLSSMVHSPWPGNT